MAGKRNNTLNVVKKNLSVKISTILDVSKEGQIKNKLDTFKIPESFIQFTAITPSNISVAKSEVEWNLTQYLMPANQSNMKVTVKS